jgi:hypothetical protein
VLTASLTLSSGGTVSVSSQSTLAVQGNVTLGADALLVLNVSSSPSGIPYLSATGSIIVSGASLQLNVPPTVTEGTIVVAVAPVLSGTFGTISVFSSSPTAACPLLANSTTSAASASATSLTVTVSTQCNSGLSTGTIVGIAVGAVVAGALLALRIVLFIRWRTAKYESSTKAKIAKKMIYPTL